MLYLPYDAILYTLLSFGSFYYLNSWSHRLRTVKMLSPSLDQSRATYLKQAITMGQAEKLKNLLIKGASLNWAFNKKTLFETAMRSASNEVTEAILSVDSRGFSKLHLACLRNDLVGVKQILEFNDAKACINDYVSFESLDWPGFTPLHFAVSYSCSEIIEILLDNGASVACLDAKQMSPLHYAIMKKKHQRKMLRILLLLIIKNKCKTIDYLGMTLLHVACLSNDDSLLKTCLQKQGTEINACIDSKSHLWPKWTALHFAASYNRLQAAKVLLWHGANVAAVSEVFGMTPLHLAHRYGNKKIVDLMLPFVDGTSNPVDSFGMSYLHIASSRRDLAAVQRLLAGGANADHRVDTNSPVWFGLSSLEIALRFDRATIAEALARCSSSDAMNLLASRRVLRRRGAHRALERLLTQGLYRPDGAAAAVGNTPLQYACKRGFVELGACLLKHGAQPDRCGRDPATPLELALLYRRERLIQLLVDAGANLYHTTDPNCPNALDYLISTIVFRHNTSRSSLQSYYYNVISCFIEAGLDTVDINRAMRRSTVNTIAAWALLQHGADVNAVGRNGKSTLWHYFRGSSCFGDNLGNYAIFRDHLQKLRTIGLPISPENEALFREMQLRYEKGYARSVRYDVAEQCELECAKLKRTQLTKYTTLHDVVFKGPNDMALLVRNDAFMKILMGEDFDEQYPMYGFLLRIQFRRGWMRRMLLQSAQEVFQLSSDFSRLPDSCFYEIFTYLSNEDLRNFSKARAAS